MLCVSIGNVGVEECLKAVKSHELTEVRLDRMDLTPADIKNIFSSGMNIIASYRPGVADDGERIKKLKLAMNSGAAYVDIEVDSSSRFKEEIMEHAKKRNCKLIVSYHNYDETPSSKELRKVLNQCKALRPDVVKIACESHSKRDNSRLLALLNSDVKMIVIGMGKEGVATRKMALKLGAFCTYVALSEDTKTAPGQLTKKEMEEL